MEVGRINCYLIYKAGYKQHCPGYLLITAGITIGVPFLDELEVGFVTILRLWCKYPYLQLIHYHTLWSRDYTRIHSRHLIRDEGFPLRTLHYWVADAETENTLGTLTLGTLILVLLRARRMNRSQTVHDVLKPSSPFELIRYHNSTDTMRENPPRRPDDADCCRVLGPG